MQYAKRSSQSCHNFCTLTNWHIKRVKKVVSVPDISGGIIKLIRTGFNLSLIHIWEEAGEAKILRLEQYTDSLEKQYLHGCGRLRRLLYHMR